MGVGKVFLFEGPIVDFLEGGQNNFSRGLPKVVKLHFTNSILREKTFFY